MRAAWIVLIPVFALSTWAQAEVVLSDDFEQGVRGDVWFKWPQESSDIPVDTLHTSDSANHTPDGELSARAWEADPAGYAAYADFGATSGTVRAETWIYDPFEDQGLDTSRPVSIMLALIG